ncbi:penicillin acylase family protein [Ferrimonas balearica]|uniref:penicillin acylase family protein n=1 Tax=Ferrimonas balearica TaxID=44012 RepID=UPI001C561F8F|nr:penicillin acylase family protein [Ferrimonas balearica]MBW3138707.1 penicillin acylase family protein [Ferrimonas balearica]MBY6105768.1 penicillin acylase family protein [Ferrimonas balearica]
MNRWIGVVALCAGAAAVATWAGITHQQPEYQGSSTLPGLQAPVSVKFDEFGVPTIEAAQDQDALRALGWLHAQERLFQMDLLRRVGKGEVAALLGAPGLPTDRLFRTLGTRHWAQVQVSQMEASEPELTEWVDAYYQGVNQAIATLPAPMEYRLLGIQPEPFSRVDAFATLSYMAHSFTSAFKQDPLLTALVAKLDPIYHPALVSGWPDDYPAQLTDQELTAWQEAAATLDQRLPLGTLQGSNGWVISPQRSASGAPLFANDPHIAFSTPQVWYEAQLHTPNRQLYGYYLPGLPLPLLGRTPERVWGLTMLLNDDADLYRLTPAGEGYQFDDQPRPYTAHVETIHISDGTTETLTVRQSLHGPRVDAVLNLPEPTALQWTFTEPRNRPLTGLYQLLQSEDMASFEAALEPIWSPGVNVLYGDTEGNIAKWAVARYLQRAPGVSGALVLDGSISATLPLGYHPYSDNPRYINPPSGIVFSANHPYGGPWQSLERAGYYAPTFRPALLEQALSAQPIWQLDQLKAVQTDSRNGRAEQLKALLLDTVEPGPERDLLARWDGRYHPQSAAPTLIEAVYQSLLRTVLEDELGAERFDALQRQSLVDRIMAELLHDPHSPWWDHTGTATAERRQDILRAAWADALAALPQPIPLWENQGQMRHRHPLGEVPALAALFEGPGLAITGSKRAINNMAYRYGETHPIATFGPSTRRLVDLAEPLKGHAISPLGQSGIPFSPHFADQAEAYAKGDYRRTELRAIEGEPDIRFHPQ